MLKLLKTAQRLNITILLLTMALFCLLLSLFRCIYTGGTGYLFLNWNLFLGFIPWFITSVLIVKPTLQKSKITVAAALVLWFVFFPNSIYIITDLLHLDRRSAMPKWFDMFLILSFSWSGLLFGFYSLLDIEQIMLKHFKKLYLYIFFVLLLFIASYGVYLGRYIRLNSWQIFTSPLRVITAVKDTIIIQDERNNAFNFSFIMGVFSNMVFWCLHAMKNVFVTGAVK